jgi:ribosome recycling factor
MSDGELINAAIDETREKMSRAVDHTKGEFSTVRTGRAAPALVEKLKIEYFGADVPLQQIAGVTVSEARVLLINPYDRTALGAIEKAIQQSDLGVNPSNDGAIIRLVFPQLNEERRKELVKLVHKQAEEGRVAVRNLRRAARHDIEGFEKDGDVSSDEVERAEKDLDRVTHEFVAEIDRLVAHKEQELLEV